MKFPNAFKITGLIVLMAFPAFLQAQKYVQVWGDEFNEPGLPDNSRWGYETGYVRNDELQYYTRERLANARIEDSVLILEARKEYYQGASYTSASLTSRGTGDWRYGKIEVRVKVPEGKGTWPAVWMMPTYSEYGGWPRSGEIDIMEHIGVEPNTLHHYVHVAGTDGTGHQGFGRSYAFTAPYDQFIKFTLIWTPEKMEWYANDTLKYTYTKNTDDYRLWPFDKKFHLKLNLAYGGTWGGYDGVDDSKLPHQFLIDYVRVYKLQETQEPFLLEIDPAEGGTVQIEPDLDAYPEGTEVTLTAIPGEGYAFKAWKHFSRANPFTFTMNRNTVITPEFINEQELIENSTFDASRVPWEFYVSNPQTTSYLASVSNGVLTVNVTKSPGTDWQLGFQQLGFAMKNGTYKLTFDAWADQQKQLLVTVSKNYSDYGEIVGKRFPVTSSPETYEWILNMPRDDNNVRLYFGVGNFTGKFYIDNISLTRVTATALQPSKEMQQGITVFPNPADGSFTLQIHQHLAATSPLVEIFTLEGRKVLEQKLESIKTTFSGEHFEPGIYLLKVQSTGLHYHTRLVIK